MIRKAVFAALLLITALTAYMYSAALRDPVIRRANVSMTDWPADALPIKVMLISDVHVAGPDMPPSRLARIAEQVNAAQPDLVLFAGDFVSDKRLATTLYDGAAAMAPLAKLRAPMGAVAVMGNHDHWRGLDEMMDALDQAGVRILTNDAARFGPLVIGGADDDFTGHADLGATLAAMDRLAGPGKAARVILSHSPDIVPQIPNAGKAGHVSLILAGHTHCGQIRFPIIGALSYVSRYGDRYACGIIRENGKTIVVGAGLGTSILPLRLGAVPDMWLLTLGPKAK
jgi:predicted MPP superfamily phosphohydrolase